MTWWLQVIIIWLLVGMFFTAICLFATRRS
jgi:hypothetical protein